MIPGEKIVLKRLVHSLDFNPTYQSINFLHYTYISLTYLKIVGVCVGGQVVCIEFIGAEVRSGCKLG